MAVPTQYTGLPRRRGFAKAKGGYANSGIQHDYSNTLVHHAVGLGSLHKVDALAYATGLGKGINEGGVVNETVVQGVVADDDMGVFRSCGREGGQHTDYGLLHAAVGRIAPDLRVRVQLQGKEEVGSAGTIGRLEFFCRALLPAGAGKDTQKPAPDLVACTLWAMSLEMIKEGPHEYGPCIMPNGHPGLVDLWVAELFGNRWFGTFGSQGGQGFSGLGQGGETIDATGFHGDVVRAQIPFLVGPDPEASKPGKQYGFPVQRTPVTKDMEVGYFLPVHELGYPGTPEDVFLVKGASVSERPVPHVATASVDADDPVPLLSQGAPQPAEKGAVGPLEEEMCFHQPLPRSLLRMKLTNLAQIRPRICPLGCSRRKQTSSALQKFSVCQS